MVRGYLVGGVTVTALLFLSANACAQAAPAQQPAAEAPKQEAPKPDFEPHSGQAGKDVVWVPTPQATVDKMLEMTRVTASDYVIDLGSGDGITVITAAKKGATAVGIEFNPDMVALAKKRAAEAGVADKASFIQGDLFEADLSKATVITLFLLPQINEKLRPKILDLKPGTRVASNSFDMKDWKPDATATSEPCSQWCTALYWVVPAKVGGTWTLGNQTLTFVQTFQMLEGTLGKAPISDGRLTGAEITFTAGGKTYTGTVDGNTIKGSGWTATKTAAAQ